ncbi:MAG TPA: hypothetical protein VJ761_00210 [Ktedonobacteraceae bacterium]|nr:hypothetical protein [Ktedonobacteraceae bacterium]
MADRVQRRSTPGENVRAVARVIPWRLLLLLPILIVLAFPAFLFGTKQGQRLLPALTNYFYNISGPPPAPTPTPVPPFPTLLPQAGSILYTVQAGDSCDEILTAQMRMADASQIFSDANPNTVKALNTVLGQNCHLIQPGMVLALPPQYPLVALGGVVLQINPTTPQQPLPTPLINVARQQNIGIDCSGGCLLTVRIAPDVEIHLLVQTALSIKVGSWVWAQATLARKVVPGFANYPYADPAASFNGMSLRACDLQVDNTHDDNSLSCSQLLPNTIVDDNGAWLLGVTGSGSLDHWRYPLHLPTGTRVLLWLTLNNNGNLVFHKGNPAYRYDETTHVYVKV